MRRREREGVTGTGQMYSDETQSKRRKKKEEKGGSKKPNRNCMAVCAYKGIK